MIEEQTIVTIKPEELIARVTALRDEGYRLVQICATKTDTLELNYTFDKDYRFMGLKIVLPTSPDATGGVGASPTAAVPSVSGVYWSAFLYENEMKDLFNINIKDIAIDYKGTFYRTSVKWPFNPAPAAGAQLKEEKKND